MSKYCYDCGLLIEKQDMNKEHIPAQCFFVGYGIEYKKNRITVPAHILCNDKYSKIDQELRDAIGIMTNNQTDKAELTSKSVRSILGKSKGVERISSDKGSLFVDFNYSDLKTLHIKNFKGVFYHEYKMAIPATFRIEVISDGDQSLFPIDRVKPIYDVIDSCVPNWKTSGHQEIFKYKIGVLDVTKGSLTNFDVSSSNQFVFSILVYHEEIVAFLFAGTAQALSTLHSNQ